MTAIRARLGRQPRTQLMLVAALALVAIVLLAGCGSRRGLGAGESWSGVAVQGDAAYVGTRDGRIIAIELVPNDRGRVNARVVDEFVAEDGREESDDSRILPAFYGTPTLVGDRLYAGSYQGFVYSLAAIGRDGVPTANVTGSFEIEGDDLRAKGINGSVAVSGGKLVVGASEDSRSGRLYVLDAAALDDRGGPAAEDCRYPARGQDPVGQIWTTPVVKDGIAYFGDLDHFVHAVRLDGCGLVWEQPAELDGAIVASPLIVGRRLYVGSLDRGFYSIDLATGTPSRLFDGGNWFWSAAVNDGTTIYAPNMDGRMYSYSIGSGTLSWSYDQEGGREAVLAAPVVVDGRVIMASDSGILTLLDESGDSVHRLGTAGDKIRAPLTSAGSTVYVHSLEEVITAYIVDSNGLSKDWELELEGF